MPIQLRAQVAPTYSMPRFESGNVSAPTIAFDASQSTGLSYADGIALSHNGAQVLHVGNTVTVDAVLVGNGAGLSGIHASNVVGLTAALDTIDASSVTANTFAGDGSGLSNIAAANVTGLTAALDVIDASSVSSNVFIGDGSGLSNISTANLAGNLTVDDLTVATLSSHLLPSANVTYDLGNPTQRFRDLFLAGNTIDLAGALIQALGANVFIQNLDVGTITGNGRGLSGVVIPPSINIITITDSNWNPIDDLALSTSSTGYLTIQGNNFEATGTTVSVGGTAASSISFVNSNTLRVSVNPKSTGTYDVVVQTGGGSVTEVNGVSFDPFPVWSTGSSLGNVEYGNPFSITLAASDGGSAITYSNTSALPPSTTLASNGVLQGNISLANSATYNFSVEAIDAQLQSALRNFSLSYVVVFSASGGTVTTSGGYTYHTFTGNGTFTVEGTSTIDILVVGGGGGGALDFGGGGGGGRVFLISNVGVLPGTHMLSVGSGGIGGFIASGNTPPDNTIYSGFTGSTSSITINGTTYSAAGGTGGGNGQAGGSGNGGSSSKTIEGSVTSYTGGLTQAAYYGGGGAGAGGNGTNSGSGGGGGNGEAVWGTMYGGGGGGGKGYNTSAGVSPGGTGGGGAGGRDAVAAVSGTNGLGGGGGSGGGRAGVYSGTSGSGGSGVVIVRYLS
jgi:hypothetical protein